MTALRSLTVIVGGSGFIGTRLAARLAARDEAFVILDRRPSARFPGHTRIVDVRDGHGLRDMLGALSGATTIVNLAAEHRDDVRPRSRYDEVNVVGARNVCVAAESCGVHRIIFTSSVAVYGFAPPDTDESGAIAPFNDYGRTKARAEEIYRSWALREPGRSLAIVRPTVVFGEGNRGNVYNLLHQIASGRFVMVGSGRNRKSMAYVENVAAFLEHLLCAPPGELTCNFVDTPAYSMAGLVRVARRALGKSSAALPRVPYWTGYLGGLVFDTVSAVTGKRFPVSAIRVRKFASDTVYTSSVLASIPGFTPPVSLSDAIERTVRYEFCEDHSGDVVFMTE